MTMTITEALAELKTLSKRVAKKREFVGQYLLRQEMIKDPLEKDGGSESVVASERQAIGDLENRLIKIRGAIQRANEETIVAINGSERPISDWLVWRREVAPNQQAFLGSMQRAIASTRQEAMQKGLTVGAGGETTKPQDVVVNLNEKALCEEIEGLEETLGVLDGLLSLKNATVMVDV